MHYNCVFAMNSTELDVFHGTKVKILSDYNEIKIMNYHLLYNCEPKSKLYNMQLYIRMTLLFMLI